MAENNKLNKVTFANTTGKLLYPKNLQKSGQEQSGEIHKAQYFWSGTPVAAPGDLPSGGTTHGTQKPTAAGALKFATVYVDNVQELPTTRQFISAFDISPIKEFGPFGTKSQQNYSFILGDGESIQEVIVRHGYIVDAIGFVVADAKGENPSTKIFGGEKGIEDRIPLQSGGEYITKITGTYGKYAYSGSDAVVGTLTIHTNLKQYGPYGKGELVENARNFEITPSDSVIGFFGTHSNYLDSIGVYQSSTASCKAYAESGPVGPIDWNVVEVKLGLSVPSVVYIDDILKSKVEATVLINSDATVAFGNK